MKNIFLFLMLSPVFFGFLTSCSTIEEVMVKRENVSRTIDYHEREITKQPIYQKPLVADLDVSEKKLSFSRTYENISPKEAQDYVSAEFAMGQNCDVIVHPIYETVTTYSDGSSKVDVTITGYPAFYKNIRNFEVKDVDAWHIYSYMNEPIKEVIKVVDTARPALVNIIPQVIEKSVSKRAKTRVGLSLDMGLLNSSDKDYWKSGIGGSLLLLTPLSKRFSYTMNFSYLYFGGKFIDFNFGTTDPFNFASGNLGFRYTSPINIYAEFRAGYGDILYDDGNGGVADESGFNYVYSLGFHYKSLDMSVRKEITKSVDFDFTGLRLGIYF